MGPRQCGISLGAAILVAAAHGSPCRALGDGDDGTLGLFGARDARVLYSADTERRAVALTIDDAPDSETTPAILAVLERSGAHATFFVIADQIPVRIVDYLNDLNAEYASGAADYDWSGYHDNCVHTLHNALAAGGVWKPKSVRVIKLRQFFHMAIPANAVVDLAALGNLEPIGDLRRIARSDVLRAALETYDWLPMRHGVLMKSLPIHQDNDLFDTKARLLVVSKPFGGGANRRADLMLRDARGTELEANLRWYRSLYEQVLAEREGARRPLFAGDDYDALQARYYDYVQRQLDDVSDMLQRLGGLRDALGTSAAPAPAPVHAANRDPEPAPRASAKRPWRRFSSRAGAFGYSVCSTGACKETFE